MFRLTIVLVLSDVVVIIWSAIITLTANGKSLVCATIAFSEGIVIVITFLNNFNNMVCEWTAECFLWGRSRIIKRYINKFHSQVVNVSRLECHPLALVASRQTSQRPAGFAAPLNCRRWSTWRVWHGWNMC